MPTLPMFRPEGQTIAELLMRQGDIAGRAALARGAAWGNAIAGIGEAAAGAYTQYKQQKDQQKREQMLDAAMMEFDPANPRAFYRKAAVAVGATEAARLMTGLASMMKVGQGQEPTPADLKSVLGSLSAARKVYRDEGLTQRWSTMAPLLKKYEPLLGAPVPDDYTPQVGEWIDQTLAGLDQQQKAPGTRLITRRLPDGSEVQEIVEDKPGQTFASAPEPKKEESASLETRIANAYAAGDQQLVAQLLNLKARMAAAGREPDKPSASVNRFARATVMVDGKPVTANYDSASGRYFDANTGKQLSNVTPDPGMATRAKQDAKTAVARQIGAVKDLSQKLITQKGPKQRIQAMRRGAASVMGNDPEYKAYQDVRFALAGNLAVAQQGTRPSDSDIRLIWLPMVPDPFTDTNESAKIKWEMVEAMSGVNLGTGPTVGERRVINGENAEWDGSAWVAVEE